MSKKLLFVLLLVIQGNLLKAGIVISNGLTHHYKVENNQVYKGKISLENNGREAQTVKLFLQDLKYEANGTIHYLELKPGALRSNADWIKFSTNLLTLKAGEKTDFLYEIQVPSNTTLPGSYWSVIIVEPVKPINPSEKGVSIHSVVRYAIQIISDLRTDNAHTDLKFENVKISSEGNKRILKLAISNTGELFCKPLASIDIYDKKNGQKLGTFTSTAMGLLPNNSKTFSIDITQAPTGLFNTIIMAMDENENTFALKAEQDIKND